jgi:hypothetical protein
VEIDNLDDVLRSVQRPIEGLHPRSAPGRLKPLEEWKARLRRARRRASISIGERPGPQPDRSGPRPVIVHYHIFKNAGSSLDRTLRENFRERWTAVEAPASDTWMTPDEMGEHIAGNSQIDAWSSHTAALPAPVVADADVLAVLFVRHPIDRARSVYEFERTMEGAQVASVEAAKEMPLSEYLTWRLDRAASGGDHTIANFQTIVLGKAGQGATPLERALDAVNRIAFVGVVEAYERSLGRLQQVLARPFPRIRLTSYRVNASSHGQQLSSRLEDLRACASPVYERLVEANVDDLRLWTAVCQRILGETAHPRDEAIGAGPGSRVA